MTAFGRERILAAKGRRDRKKEDFETQTHDYENLLVHNDPPNDSDSGGNRNFELQ